MLESANQETKKIASTSIRKKKKYTCFNDKKIHYSFLEIFVLKKFLILLNFIFKQKKKLKIKLINITI